MVLGGRWAPHWETPLGDPIVGDLRGIPAHAPRPGGRDGRAGGCPLRRGSKPFNSPSPHPRGPLAQDL